MDIHRCRFVEWPPSAINALAFSHSSGVTGKSQPLRLAIGRANGDIEIWDPRKGIWLHETTLHGGRDRSVEGLTWVQDPDQYDESGYVTYGRLRLFSIGYSSAVTEWDLSTGIPLRESSGSHSDVWCLAAQPRAQLKKPPKKSQKEGVAEHLQYHAQNIAAGCADGSLILLSTSDDSLTFTKYIARTSEKKARALCVAWQNPDIIAAGFSDSSVRIYNVTTNQAVRTISLGAGPRGGPKEKLCWAVEPLADGTLVTGDSSGEVCFWDAKTYGQLQRVKAHDADTLCLTASADGKTVMSGGMDRRICVFRTGENGRWSKLSHRKVHQHDVKTIASYENKAISIAVSGGVDANPVVNPLREWGTEYHRTLPFTPQLPPISSSQRLLASWWNNQVSVWRVGVRDTASGHDDGQTAPTYSLMARLALKNEEHVTRASIAQHGSLLAVATSAEVKLFQLTRSRKGGDMPKVKKVPTPTSLSKHGARLLEFSPDAKWLLAVDVFNTVRLHRVFAGETPVIAPRSVSLSRADREGTAQNCLNGPWGSYSRTISRASFSSNSRILAVADLAGYIDSWLLEGDEDLTAASDQTDTSPTNADPSSSENDSDDEDDKIHRAAPRRAIHGQRWRLNPTSRTLPKLPAPPLILSFQPGPPHDTLLTLTASHDLQLYSLATGLLTPWSRRNPPALLPAELKLQRDRASGCLWDGARVWLYAASWLAMLDLAQDLPGPAAGPGALAPRKRKRSLSTSAPSPAVAAALASRKTTSGAGDRMRADEADAGLALHAALALEPDGAASLASVAEAPLRRRPAVVSSSADDDEDDDALPSDDEDDDGNATALQRYRRAQARSGSDDGDDADGDANGTGPPALLDGRAPAPRAFYLTNRYRPILGIVPLGADDGGGEGEGAADGPAPGTLVPDSQPVRRALEVALVERPLWEVDMPARFGER